jgi:hypothetical protein
MITYNIESMSREELVEELFKLGRRCKEIKKEMEPLQDAIWPPTGAAMTDFDMWGRILFLEDRELSIRLQEELEKVPGGKWKFHFD